MIVKHLFAILSLCLVLLLFASPTLAGNLSSSALDRAVE